MPDCTEHECSSARCDYYRKKNAANGSKLEIKVTDSVKIYFLDGKRISEAERAQLNYKNIASIKVLKDQKSKEAYGITEDNPAILFTTITKSAAPLFLLDGNKISDTEAKKIKSSTIESINVLKGDQATEKYGPEAKSGIVLITSKKTKTPSTNK